MSFWANLGTSIKNTVNEKMDEIRKYMAMSDRELAKICLNQRSGNRSIALGVLKKRGYTNAEQIKRLI